MIKYYKTIKNWTVELQGDKWEILSLTIHFIRILLQQHINDETQALKTKLRKIKCWNEM